MKTLNIDALAAESRTITLFGKEYPVLGMTVANFIETTKAAERLEGNTNIGDQLEETVKMISRAIPDCPIENFRRLKLEQLTVISKFIRGEDLDEKPAAEGEDEKKSTTP